MHAKLADEITLQQSCTNQRKWLAENWDYSVQGAENNSLCCHNSHCFNKPRCHANM